MILFGVAPKANNATNGMVPQFTIGAAEVRSKSPSRPTETRRTSPIRPIEVRSKSPSRPIDNIQQSRKTPGK